MTTYKLIGEDPTEEMLAAAWGIDAADIDGTWKAMWKAAPEVKQEPIEINWPDYHAEGMGCGLEDRCITDRYDAMHYGWDKAIERCAQCVPDALYVLPPDAQAEIAKRDARIAELEQKLADATKDAARFNALQNMPAQQAQAFFWNYQSRKERARAIDTAMREPLSANPDNL